MDNELMTELILLTDTINESADCLAPDGPEIRLLPKMKGGDLHRCTLPAGKTSSPSEHRHIEEIWYVLEGKGEIWRKASGAEEIVGVSAGMSLTIPPRTAFQPGRVHSMHQTMLDTVQQT